MTDEIKYGEILSPESDEAREKKVRKGFWRTMKRAVKHLPFAEDVVAGYYCAIDRSTPARVRTMLLGALAYFVLPLDTIPDLLAGIGFTDDAAVLFATLALVRAHIKPQHREAARQVLAEDSPGGTPPQ